MTAAPTVAINTAGIKINHLRRRAICNTVSNEYSLFGITRRPHFVDNWNPGRNADAVRVARHLLQQQHRSRITGHLVVVVGVLTVDANVLRQPPAQPRGRLAVDELAVAIEAEFAAAGSQ